ncbi:MAG: MBL fold metallo-hydrolase [Phycisphaeraceae bacterium]
MAGQQTFVMLPELSISFDIGTCPPPVLAADTIALTHGHADHAAGLLYYMAQRYRTRMGPGTVVCPPPLTDAIAQLARCGAQLEGHTTPVHVVGLPPDAIHDLGNGHRLRGFETHHTVPSTGFLIEHAQRDEQGEGPCDDRPLAAYTGDTTWGPCFQREDVLAARVLITECSFFHRAYRQSARHGGHLHLDHIRALMDRSDAEAVVLTHLPRQLTAARAKKILLHTLPRRHHGRLFLLMDHCIAAPDPVAVSAKAQAASRLRPRRTGHRSA